jgi:hypothetical protein
VPKINTRKEIVVRRVVTTEHYESIVAIKDVMALGNQATWDTQKTQYKGKEIQRKPRSILGETFTSKWGE